ncbi:Mhp366/Mhp367 family surface (lipo)protein [Mesomycoplasma conjunctivae]|uniref:Mhp366/Mhp367 family surface (lipo)protein n=1 Tax=Mesomycoplasma conjunctivae TaxID=45361 RepID=UPI003DA42266
MKRKKIIIIIWLTSALAATSFAAGGYFLYNKITAKSKNPKNDFSFKAIFTNQLNKNTNNEDHKFQLNITSKNLLDNLEQEANSKFGNIEAFFSPITNKDLKEVENKKILFPTEYQKFNIDINSNFAVKENNDFFLGSKNSNLFVYNLNIDNPESIILDTSENKKKILNQKGTLLDVKSHHELFPLPYVGFKNKELADQKYENIFQRNIKFLNGTASVLDINSEKALFLTNNHVLDTHKVNYKKISSANARFWNVSVGNFMQWYDNGQSYSVKSNDLLSLFFVKDFLTSKQKKKLLSLDDVIRGSNKVKLDEKQQEIFFFNFFNKYFQIPANFKNFNVDIAIFYFRWSKFLEDINQLASFYQKNNSDLQEFITTNSRIKPIIDNFLQTYQKLVSFWIKMSQNPPVKIANTFYKQQSINYKELIALFWPYGTPLKNHFKGIYSAPSPGDITQLAIYFYANNGPGASGSAIFDTKGELQFVNAFGLINNFYDPNIKNDKQYYDNLNTYIPISGGIPLITANYNLKDEIEKFYPSKINKQNIKFLDAPTYQDK